MKEKIKEIIKKDSFLNLLAERLLGVEAYLVGGYIRDLALYYNPKTLNGRNFTLKNLENPDCEAVSHDRDIVLFNCDTENVARNLADSIGAAFVELDPENKIYRIVSGEEYADIACGLNNSVDDDIERRDFTINSIFYSLKDGEFYDKNDGFGDIERGIIKTARLWNLSEDPLRMLRAYRFKSKTGFKIDNNVQKFTIENLGKLDSVAKERVKQEVIKLFEGDFLIDSLLEMLDIGLLEAVFPFVKNIKKIPPNSHHHLDLVHHSIETTRCIRQNNPLLKLSAFYHDIGKPECWTIEPENGRHRFIGHDEIGGKLVAKELSALKFSKKEIEYVSKMVKNHIYPSSLAHSAGSDGQKPSNKALARFVRKIHPHVEDLIELARADRLSARGEAVSDKMVEDNLKNLENLLEYYNSVKNTLQTLPKLLDGKEIMEILKIAPGPKLREIIDNLKEAQIEGTVKTRDDAVLFIKNLEI